MKKLIYSAIFLTLCLFSCSKETKEAPTVGGPPTNGGGEPTNPINPGRNVLAWVDAQSNVFGTYGKFSNKSDIVAILDKLEDCGVNGLVIDVKLGTGYTMYKSDYNKEQVSYGGKTKPTDYVEFLISEAKKRKMKAYISLMTFVEGEGGIGYVYDNPEYKERNESIVVRDANGTLGRISTTGGSVFVNPAQPEVQERVLNLLKEITGKFEIDGVMLDFCRYSNINADFSDFSKNQFIQFMKNKFNDAAAANMDFPKDIVKTWKVTSGQVEPSEFGKYYKQWLYYRASVIQDFVKKARVAVKSIKPDVTFGSYVGAWYGNYHYVGVNWASKDYDPFQDYNLRMDWAYPGYGETGYLEEVDMLMTGNYFTQVLLSENPLTASMKYHWWSMEGSLNGIDYITKNKRPIYGSMDLGNVPYASKSEITRAIKYILSRTSGGIMLFDVVHMYGPQYNYLKEELFDAVKAGIKN